MPTAEEYQRHIDNGWCVSCHKPPLKGYRQCAFHHEQNLKAHRRYYRAHLEKMASKKAAEIKRMKEEGRCNSCFNLLQDGMGKSRCPDCMDSHSNSGVVRCSL